MGVTLGEQARKEDRPLSGKNLTSCLRNHYSIVSNRLTYKTSTNHPGVKVVRTFWRQKKKTFFSHVDTSSKQTRSFHVVARMRNEKIETARAKRAKLPFLPLNVQIWDDPVVVDVVIT